MKLTRRAFVGAGIAAGATPWDAFADQQVLTAAPAAADLGVGDGVLTNVWAYGGSTPGPELRVKQGARISRHFRNDLPQPSTIHWHGLRLANAMDGVPGLTQDLVEPGGGFAYDFVAPDAGTYWYHPHNATYEQMARGLYGPLIVDEVSPPGVDRDITLMFDDWRLDQSGQIDTDFRNMHDWSHGGRIGNFVTVNGAPVGRVSAQRNERLQLRLINAANARVFRIGAKGLRGWVVALDGQPLERPEPFDTITLAPAQRADLIVDILDPEEALFGFVERNTAYALVEFPVSGAARGEPLGEPGALPPNYVPEPVLNDGVPTHRLEMTGGAMGGLRTAMKGGVETSLRELAREGKVWAFNGSVDMPEAPFIDAGRGQTVRISIVNDTGWSHGMHLHGHHFRDVAATGLGPLRDTILLDRGETRDIAFVADNPGDWLLHCHMLEHSAGGMMTWLRVA